MKNVQSPKVDGCQMGGTIMWSIITHASVRVPGHQGFVCVTPPGLSACLHSKRKMA